jgi:hypothetical protein
LPDHERKYDQPDQVHYPADRYDPPPLDGREMGSGASELIARRTQRGLVIIREMITGAR